jgi:hypothetical protein
MKRTGGRVHAVAQCQTCAWFSEDYATAWQIGRLHAERYKHRVTVDVGLVYTYDCRATKKRRKP